MKFIINLIARMAGAGKALAVLNGKKTYISGAALILSGLAQLLEKLVLINDAAGILSMARGLPNDGGFLAILAGLTAMNLRHANAKIEDKLTEKTEKPESAGDQIVQ